MAAATYFDTVQKIYIAFYQRPADPAGLKYWAERIEVAGGDATAVVTAFATSPEAVALYGAINATTIGTVIDKIYLALFNKAPDAAGKQFYVDGFTSGKFTAGTIALNILNGAANDDAVAIANKLQVANEFTKQVDGRALTDAYFGTGSSFNATYSGDTDAQAARDILKTVTSSPATVLSQSQVTEQIQSKIADAGDPIKGETAGKTFTLTSGMDIVVGTANNDTIKGKSSELGGLDSIDGGAGVDTMKLINDSASGTMTITAGAIVQNVENLELTNGGTGGATSADVQTWTGLQSIVVDQRVAVATTINTKSNATSVSIKGGSGSTGATVIDNGSGTGATKDTLASVTLEKVTGSAAVTSDALTTLNLIDNSGDVTVTAAAGTRVLNLGLNKVVGGTITDAEATGLKIAATGADSSKITLTTAKATTIDFSGDKTVSLGLGDQAANLVITSSNTAGVTLTSALDTDVTFTGGAGKDSVTVGATTKTIDMGAGDDTVTVSVALGTNGKIVGGDGIDTLKMASAAGATLSANDTFSKAVEGFEKISLEAVSAGADNTVNLANLDNINYVISAGTAAGGTTEKSVVTIADLTLGQSITINGVTVTATAAGGATAAQIAAAFAAGTTNANLSITGTVGSAWTPAAVAGEPTKVEFTSTVAGNVVTNLLPTTGGAAAPTTPTVNKLNDGDGAAVAEKVQILVGDLVAGQSVTVNGIKLTAHKALTGAEVATALGVVTPATSAGNYAITGAKTIVTLNGGNVAANSFVLTDTGFTNVADVAVSAEGVTAPLQGTVAVVSTTEGVAGAALTVSNMANAGTFELTDVVAGAATVTMKDATGSADVLNIRLNGTGAITNTGTLTVAGVETINLEVTDSSADTPTLTNPAAASKPNLVVADTTKIVVTGNHGVNFTGSTLTKVVELDASAVVATGATTGATATEIATAGAVTFTSAVTDKNVTVKTGNGADVINLASVTDVTKGATVMTGEGDDTITGTSGNDTITAGAGRDTVNASAGADTITLGAGNDVYVLGAATNSTLAKSDTITDFVANTKGVGTTADQIKLGATGTVADLTGDTINVSAAITLAGVATTGITVFVATNAADAQTFLQNTGNAGTLTGFALDSTTGKLYMDFDSNGTVDSVITLTGVTTITEAAFVTGLAV